LADGDEGNVFGVVTAIRSEDGSIGGDASGSEKHEPTNRSIACELSIRDLLSML
jgi:hypothetical protein